MKCALASFNNKNVMMFADSVNTLEYVVESLRDVMGISFTSPLADLVVRVGSERLGADYQYGCHIKTDRICKENNTNSVLIMNLLIEELLNV